MSAEAEKKLGGVYRWALAGAVIGGVLIPLIAISVDPLIPEHGWMFPQTLRLSLMPGAFFTMVFLGFVDSIIPSAHLAEIVLPAPGGNVLWIVIGAPLNAVIYGYLGFVLWWGIHGKKWLLVMFGVPVMGSWLAFNVAGLFLIS